MSIHIVIVCLKILSIDEKETCFETIENRNVKERQRSRQKRMSREASLWQVTTNSGAIAT